MLYLVNKNFFAVLFAALFLGLAPITFAAAQSKGLEGARSELGTLGLKADFQNRPVEDVVGGILLGLFSLLGVAFVVLLVYGGFIWMKARGDEKEVEKAKNIITNSVIGIVIIVLAYAITYFVLSKLKEATGAAL